MYTVVASSSLLAHCATASLTTLMAALPLHFGALAVPKVLVVPLAAALSAAVVFGCCRRKRDKGDSGGAGSKNCCENGEVAAQWQGGRCSGLLPF